MLPQQRRQQRAAGAALAAKGAALAKAGYCTLVLGTALACQGVHAADLCRAKVLDRHVSRVLELRSCTAAWCAVERFVRNETHTGRRGTLQQPCQAGQACTAAPPDHERTHKQQAHPANKLQCIASTPGTPLNTPAASQSQMGCMAHPPGRPRATASS